MAEIPIGTVGRVVVRIRGGEAPGEVSVALHGIRETCIAYADDEVAVGQDVLVVGSRGGRRVDVVPWHIAQPHWTDDSERRT
jgi:hypothetical protein